MKVNGEKYKEVMSALTQRQVLVAVSKVQPIESIKALYDMGQRDFGENYVQELVEKEAALPKDIRWHFIGHLQSNKVKYIAPFVHLIHGVDSEKLLAEISKQATKFNRRIHCLLQVHIAEEETKFGFDAAEVKEVVQRIFSPTHDSITGQLYANAEVNGLMGMASFSDDETKIRREFKVLKSLLDELNGMLRADKPSAAEPAPNADKPVMAPLSLLSMGMSGDYKLALEEGSNMIRIGSLLFGGRLYNK